MPFLTMRDGEKIFVRTIGQGKPCILLHGFAMNSTHWLPFVWPYRKNFQFILPDFRGFGRSHKVPFNQSCVLTNYAQDLEDVMDHFDHPGYLLGGISMGAYTAMHQHKIHGFDRVEKCCFIDQSPQAKNVPGWPWGLFGPSQEKRFGPIKKMLDQARRFEKNVSYRRMPKSFRKTVATLMGEFAATAMYRSVERTAVKLAFSVEALSVRILPVKNWQAYMDITAAYLEKDYDMRETIKKITVPLTVMVAVPSRMYPKQGQFFMVDNAPKARLVRFEKSGHAIPANEPIKFMRELGKFLTN